MQPSAFMALWRFREKMSRFERKFIANLGKAIGW